MQVDDEDNEEADDDEAAADEAAKATDEAGGKQGTSKSVKMAAEGGCAFGCLRRRSS